MQTPPSFPSPPSPLARRRPARSAFLFDAPKTPSEDYAAHGLVPRVISDLERASRPEPAPPTMQVSESDGGHVSNDVLPAAVDSDADDETDVAAIAAATLPEAVPFVAPGTVEYAVRRMESQKASITTTDLHADHPTALNLRPSSVATSENDEPPQNGAVPRAVLQLEDRAASRNALSSPTEDSAVSDHRASATVLGVVRKLELEQAHARGSPALRKAHTAVASPKAAATASASEKASTVGGSGDEPALITTPRRKATALTPVALSLRAARAAACPPAASSPRPLHATKVSPASRSTGTTPTAERRRTGSPPAATEGAAVPATRRVAKVGTRAESVASSRSASPVASPLQTRPKGSAVVLDPKLLAADVVSSSPVPPFVLTPVTPAQASPGEFSTARASPQSVSSAQHFASPGSSVTPPTPPSSCGDDVDALSSLSSSSSAVVASIGGLPGASPSSAVEDQPLSDRPQSRPLGHLRPPARRRQSSFIARKMPDFAALHALEELASTRRKSSAVAASFQMQDDSSSAERQPFGVGHVANVKGRPYPRRLPRASTVVSSAGIQPNDIQDSFSDTVSVDGALDVVEAGACLPSPARRSARAASCLGASSSTLRATSSFRTPSAVRPPAGDPGQTPRRRHGPTVPKPFNMPGDRFLARAKEEIERKRLEQEKVDKVRHFRARPMPDFSKDPRVH